MDALKEIEDIIRSVSKGLANHPGHIEIKRNQGRYDHQGRHDPDTWVYTIVCHPADMGYLLGKFGRNMDAIRVVTNAVAKKNRIRATAELEEGVNC